MWGEFRKPVREGLFAGSLSDLDQVALCGSRCRDCGETTLGENAVCPNCGGGEVATLPLSRDGVLWTATVVRHKPPGNYHGPDPFVPFGMGLVELADGIRVLSRIDADPGELRIGMPLRFHPYVLRKDEAGAEVVAFSFAPA